MGRVHRAGGVSSTRGRGGRYLDSSRDLVLREAALALQQLVMSGELPGPRFACQIMDEVVYPLATAPAARVRKDTP